MLLSLQRALLMTFVTFFICLFRDTFCIVFSSSFTLSSLFICRSQKSDTFLFLPSFAPTPHIRIYSGGRQRRLFSRVFGTSTIKKMLGVGPSVRFFGLATSHARRQVVGPSVRFFWRRSCLAWPSRPRLQTGSQRPWPAAPAVVMQMESIVD